MYLIKSFDREITLTAPTERTTKDRSLVIGIVVVDVVYIGSISCSAFADGQLDSDGHKDSAAH